MIKHRTKLVWRILTLLIACALTIPTYASLWQPIIGIPKPDFGFEPGDVAPPRPVPWINQEVGFFFVNTTTGNDTANSNGFPGNPRQTLPFPIPAGSYVELEGTVSVGNLIVTANGVPGSPVFIRGENSTNRPVIEKFITIKNSSYVIVEQIKLLPPPSVGLGESGFVIEETNDHIVFRDSEVSGIGNFNRTGSLGIGTIQDSLKPGVASQIVINNVDFHDLGDVAAIIDQDVHCVVVNGPAEFVWVISNTFTACSGDGIQLEATHFLGRQNVHHIYIGNNESSLHRQTGYWVKHAKDVIISSNESHDLFLDSVFSAAACGGFQYVGDYLWFINNNFHLCSKGIIAQSDDGPHTDPVEGGVFYIGNLIYDIMSPTPTNTSGSGNMVLRMGTIKHHVINNTFANGDIGLSSPVQAGSIDIFNNIFYETRSALGRDIHLEGIDVNTRLDDTVFFAASGSATIRWLGFDQTPASLRTAGSDVFGIGVQCQNCVEADPSFVDVASKDFRLKGNSPARNTGSLSAVYQLFLDRYGISIEEDLNGITRPGRLIYDMGALEADETLRPTIPTSVTAVPVL